MSERVRNYINGRWTVSTSTDWQDVVNPATGEVLGSVPLNGGRDVDDAAKAAHAAYLEWRSTPPGDRIQYLFKLKQALEDNFEDLSRILTTENGKTLADARSELRRGIENVEVACGNAMIIKPSERVPLTMQHFFGIVDKIGLPPGVLSLVNGGKETVDAILDHPTIKGVSFVGSTPVARYVYARAAANGKRVQCQAGAKNHVVILPDADIDMTSRIVSDSAFGCAGQRCLAVSVAVTVGEAHNKFRDAIAETARSLKVGSGLDASVQMGPVITKQSQTRIEDCIAQGINQGARAIVDGRDALIEGYEGGSFVNPTVLDGLPLSSELTTTEIFGPVLSLNNAADLDQAIQIINSNPFGNASSIFTTSGIAARQFRNQVSTGNVGVNIGVAAPMAYFPFSGWKDSFLGVLHGQSWDAIDFYTDKKVVVERWPREWSRRF